MPPITGNQGSRTGLVTAVVIFTVLFVVATIFAIYYAVQAQTAREDLTTFRSTIVPKYLPDGIQTGAPPAAELVAALKKGGNWITPGMPLMNVALTERNNLASAIVPSSPPATALDDARNALASASAKVNKAGVTLPSNQGNLVGAVTALSTAVVNKQQTIDQLQKQLADAQKALQSKTQELTAATEKLEQTAESIRKQAQQAEAGVASYRGQKEQQVNQLSQAALQRQNALQEQVNKLNTDVNTKNAQIAKLNNDIQTLQNKLGERRVDAAESVIRHADAQVLRIGTNDNVYLNIGANQHVIPGLTFTVYDRRTGIPPLSAGANQENSDSQVQGKAEIEVIRVDPNSSEARVVSRVQDKPPIQEGDLVANLVYDPNTTYSFYVFGRFDLDRNGVPTAQDEDVVKRLITQWGGKVTNDINVNTDFVVVGAEPVVPNLTKDEEADPILVQKRAQAQQDLNQYLEVVNKARDLHIPILNQNRFLYFVGYYDQSAR
jgi:hypothetical protein